MNRWFWVAAVLTAALVGVSLSARHRATAGEELLAALTAHGVKTREALLLLDYSPDRDLVAKARKEKIVRGAGVAPGYGFQVAIPSDQQWAECGEAVLAWHADGAGKGELRESLAAAGEMIDRALPRSPLDDTASQAALARARKDLEQMGDERLFLAWISADRGVLAEMNDREEAFRQGMLLLAHPTPGPVLMFQTVRGHVYLLPEERSHGEAWCAEEAFDAQGKQVWHGALRVRGSGDGPSTQEVRTMAVVLGEAALEPEKRQAAPPAVTPF